MKVLLAFVVLVVLGVGYWYVSRPQVVDLPEPEVIVQKETVEVNPLDAQIRAREAELDAKYDKIKTLEAKLDVLKGERERLDTEITALQKELSGFMTATASGR